MSYPWKLAGAAMLMVVVGALVIIIFENIWLQIGLVGAMVVVFGGLIGLVWLVQRKDRERRKGVDELPRV
jgi:Flp pilus assembly protein TadB